MKYIMLIILIIIPVHGFGQSDNNLIKENNCYSNRCMLNETYIRR